MKRVYSMIQIKIYLDIRYIGNIGTWNMLFNCCKVTETLTKLISDAIKLLKYVYINKKEDYT